MQALGDAARGLAVGAGQDDAGAARKLWGSARSMGQRGQGLPFVLRPGDRCRAGSLRMDYLLLAQATPQARTFHFFERQDPAVRSPGRSPALRSGQGLA